MALDMPRSTLACECCELQRLERTFSSCYTGWVDDYTTPKAASSVNVARALGYSGSLTSLRRVLADLDAHSLIAREPQGGRVQTLTLTQAGEQLLRAQGLIEDAPRQYLFDERVCASREMLSLTTATIAQRLSDWATNADISKAADELRLESALALFQDITAHEPDDDELAVLVARTRIALGNLLDTYLTDRSQVDTQLVEAALQTVFDACLKLIALHMAVSESD